VDFVVKDCALYFKLTLEFTFLNVGLCCVVFMLEGPQYRTIHHVNYVRCWFVVLQVSEEPV